VREINTKKKKSTKCCKAQDVLADKNTYKKLVVIQKAEHASTVKETNAVNHALLDFLAAQ